MDFKKSKLAKNLKNVTPNFKWAMFSKIQDYKIASKYLNYIIPEDKSINKDNEALENMVRETLIKEFSPKIKESKTFELLVDATVHNIKQKQLEAMGDLEDIEL